MPLDFPTDVPARILNRLARIGLLSDPAACDSWLRDRFDATKRVSIMRTLFPAVVCEDA